MLSGDYTFLTTRPVARRMSKAHPELLKVLPHVDVATQTLKARIYYTDATPTADYTIATWNARAGEVYSFHIGYPDVAYPSKALSWKIEIYCGTYATADEILTYYPYDYEGEQITAIYYRNSLCGIDSIICGIFDQAEDLNIASDQGVIPADFRTNSRNQREFKTLNAEARAGHQLSTGHLPRHADMLALRDLFLINHAEVYQSVGGQSRYLPIQIINTPEWPSKHGTIQAISIQYLLSSKVRSFSRSA